MCECLEPISNIQKVLVCGSRSITNKSWVHAQIEKYVQELKSSSPTNLTNPVLIEGEARGVDSLAKEYAIEHNWSIEACPADWEKFGKSAGYIRNDAMVKKADFVIILWDGESRGTKHDIDLCRRRYYKPYVLVIYKKPHPPVRG